MMCMVGEHQCTGADIEKEDCTAAGQTRDMESRGEGAVRFRPDTLRGVGGGGGGGGCCLAEGGEETYMKWGGWEGGLQLHPAVSAHGVLYSPQ